MKVIYIGERIAHHAACSGYCQLRRYIRSRDLPAFSFNALSGILGTLPRSVIAPWLDAPPHAWYWKPEQLAREIQAMARLPFSGALFHWLYGENDFRWAGRMPRSGKSRVVVSLHQPPEVFNKVFRNKDSLRKADAVIACASFQKDFLEGLVGEGKTHMVPHGVDTGYFSPKEGESDAPELFIALAVGSWLRDFPLLLRVIEESDRLKTGILFHLVLPKEAAGPFVRLPNARVFSGLTDRELLFQYHGAKALFMPLLDCTASNALLEGMACGLPVAASDAGGIRDYADASCALWTPRGKADKALEALMVFKECEELRFSMGRAARRKAMDFDWKNAAQAMMEVYEGLYAG